MPNVVSELHVRSVQQIIIQVEVDVLHVLVRNVLHVIHLQEFVQIVKVDII